MPEPTMSLLGLVKKSVLATQQSVREISDAIAGAARADLSHALQQPDQMRAAVLDIVRGTMEGARELGADVGTAAEATIVGVARSVDEVGGESVEAMRTAARGVIQITAELNGDVGRAANGVIEGTAIAASDLGWRVAHATAAAATAAFEAAEKIDAKAAQQVREAVKGARDRQREGAAERDGNAARTR